MSYPLQAQSLSSANSPALSSANPFSWQDTTNPFAITPSGLGTSNTLPTSCLLSKGGNPLNGASAGTQCGSSNPATLDTGTGVSQAAGNPINVIYGNKYQREVDMPALPGVLGLELIRHYNSQDSKLDKMPGLLGRGWTLSYQGSISVDHDMATIHQADGSSVSFQCMSGSESGNKKETVQCTSPNALQGTLTRTHLAGKEHWKWRWPNGRVLRFDEAHHLVSIEAPTGESVSMRYDDRHRLQTVTDPQGRMLSLNYPSAKDPNKDRFVGVMSIDTPVGRFVYSYETADQKKPNTDPKTFVANLSQVEIPTSYDPNTLAHPMANRGTSTSSIRRLYHYEDAVWPTLLTGISVLGTGSDGAPMHQRLSTWAYDAQGRARLSVKGDLKSTLEKVTVEFLGAANKTILTNSLGQKTIYSYAVINHALRLTEVRGAGCATCGEMNQRYRYDAVGRLLEVIQLDAEVNTPGTPLSSIQYARDQWGRITKIIRISYEHGKPVALKWIRRFDYAQPLAEPTLIATPSVIEGKEHQFHYRYTPLGQLLETTETGWSGTTPISRTTRYRYTEINGRSLLSAIEQPTDSGTKDIPTLRLEWNKKEWGGGDYLQKWTTPDGTTTTLERDQAGRVIRVTTSPSGKTTPNQGNNPTLLMQYDAQSLLTNITQQGKTTRFRYDALGRVTESGSEEQGASYITENKSGFDVVGHLLWSVDHLGILHKNRFDTESRLLEERIQSSTIQQFRQYSYNALGQLTSTQDERGGKTRIEYTSTALPEHITDALGRTQQLHYDSWGRVVERIEAANTAHSSAFHFTYDGADHLQTVITPTTNRKNDSKGATTRTEYDDFGRTIAIRSPDSGLSTRRYDAANHLIASQDAKGNQATYDYNADGHIALQTIRDAQHNETVTRWHYKDHRLVGLEHPHQEEQYVYDEQGLLKNKTVLLKTGTSLSLSSSAIPLHTAYSYTERGELNSITLPDGSLLEYQRNGQHQVVNVMRQPIQTPWLRWLAPLQPLVTDIQRDLVDVKAYHFGNGLEAQSRRTREGVLAQSELQTQTQQSKNKALLEHHYVWDRLGNLLLNKEKKTQTAYAYDPLNQLIIAKSSDPAIGHSRYFYDGSGNRLLSQEGVQDEADVDSNTLRSTYEKETNRWLKAVPPSNKQAPSLEAQYDSAGQPTQIGEQRYTWNALGQLTDVSIHHHPLAHYVYNHRGERISKKTKDQSTEYWYENGHLSAELDAHHRLTRQYFYLADQPIALLDTPEGVERVTPTDSQITRLVRDVKTLFTIWFGHAAPIAYIHTNHLNAPEMVTDAKAHILWQAHYSAFGKATLNTTPGFTLNLRLPGQFFDAETGLHYNHHRYYDPSRGQYLTPDPLGLRGGINSYAYTMNNPLAFIDPSGLVLFAFDGTANKQHPDESVDSISNVEKFRQAYNSGEWFYITGIGTTDKNMAYEGNIYNGDGYLQRINSGFKFLNGYIATAKESTVDIDIIGFSRGATEARIWARQLVKSLKNGVYTTPGGQSKCLNLRFIGLWDTVAHLDYFSGGAKAYNFNIPSAFKYAAQAVAVNEYRGGVTNFDQMSLSPYPGAKLPSNRIERGFIGSHADIGGGYATGDLSDVTLMWMIQQAKSQGINFNTDLISKKEWNVVSNPIVHDKSGNNIFPNEPIQSDRDIIYGNGQKIEQQKANIPGLTEQQGQEFISYLPTFCDTSAKTGSNPAVGTVDMAKYSTWLLKNYGLKIDYQGQGKPCQR